MENIQALICLSSAGDKYLYLENSTDGSNTSTLRTKSVSTNGTSQENLQPSLCKTSPDTTLHSGFEKIRVVASILSGTQLARPFFETALSPFLEELRLDEKYEVEFTTSAMTISDLTRDVFLPAALKGIKQLIILLSGDGGIVDILNVLASVDIDGNDVYVRPQVSLIPMGTGNALANSSGVNSDDTHGLSALARGKGTALPAFRATFSPGARLLVDEARKEEELPLKDGDGQQFMLGAVVCSWGLHAGLVADSDTSEYRKYGVDRFKMAANEALYPKDGSPPHHYKGLLSVYNAKKNHWRAIDREEHAYVLTTLVSNLEKTFKISPDSKPLEGSLRLVHFGPQSSDEVMRLMNLAFQDGQHVHEQSVGYEEVDAVRIDFKGLESDGRWRRICLDGKIIRVEADGWIEIQKEPLSLLDLRHLD